ncbi:hypothetical protein L9F63_015073, partial [Diploptera punctata]
EKEYETFTADILSLTWKQLGFTSRLSRLNLLIGANMSALLPNMSSNCRFFNFSIFNISYVFFSFLLVFISLFKLLLLFIIFCFLYFSILLCTIFSSNPFSLATLIMCFFSCLKSSSFKGSLANHRMELTSTSR